MRFSVIHVLAAGAIGLGLALGGGAPTALAKTTKECNDEYKAQKADLQAKKVLKKDFMATCKAEPDTGAAATPAAPAAAPAPAPAPAPAAAAPAPAPAQMSANEMQVKATCPTDTVVWLNEQSKIYHFAGTHNYGHTKEGAYMCEAAAKAAGNRAAKNEKHP